MHPIKSQATGQQSTQKCGIGLFLVKTASRRVFVKAIASGSAADELRKQCHESIAVGDEILAVDGQSVCSMTEEAIRDAILGAPGTAVDITFRSYDDQLLHCATLTRWSNPESGSTHHDSNTVRAGSRLTNNVPPAAAATDSYTETFRDYEGRPAIGQPDDPEYFRVACPASTPSRRRIASLFGPDEPEPAGPDRPPAELGAHLAADWSRPPPPLANPPAAAGDFAAQRVPVSRWQLGDDWALLHPWWCRGR